MNTFMKTIINGLKTWTSNSIKNSRGNWEQNDASADDYIKNRPFYTYEDEIVVLPETSFTEQEQSGLGIGVFDGSTFEIKVGEEYKVTFDGEVYSCVGYTDSSIMAGAVFLGNLTIIEAIEDTSGHTNTGEPFLFIHIATHGEAGVYTPTVDNHTISITAVGETVKKIDEKYLPELPYIVNITFGDDGYYRCDKTYTELVQMETEGITMLARLTNNEGRVFTAIHCDDAVAAVKFVAFDIGEESEIDETIMYKIVIDEFNSVEVFKEEIVTVDAFVHQVRDKLCGETAEVGQVITVKDAVNGEPIKLEAADIPEHTWESLPDKPFGEEEYTILPEQTISTNEYGGANMNLDGISVGDKLRVMYDGVEYECECYKIENYLAFGNNSAFGTPDERYPFGYFSGEGVFVVYPNATGDHTVEISRLVTKTIDKKYLPESLQFGDEPMSITWDGNTDGLVNVGTLYKVSDIILSDEEIKGAVVQSSQNNEIVDEVQVSSLWDEMVSGGTVTRNCVLFEYFCVVRSPGTYFEQTFNETGLYFRNWGADGSYTSSFVFERINKVEQKYLPENVLRVEITGQTKNDLTASHTYEDIVAAIESGKTVTVQVSCDELWLYDIHGYFLTYSKYDKYCVFMIHSPNGLGKYECYVSDYSVSLTDCAGDEVADATGETVTASEFNSLLNALRNAYIIRS